MSNDKTFSDQITSSFASSSTCTDNEILKIVLPQQIDVPGRCPAPIGQYGIGISFPLSYFYVQQYHFFTLRSVHVLYIASGFKPHRQRQRHVLASLDICWDRISVWCWGEEGPGGRLTSAWFGKDRLDSHHLVISKSGQFFTYLYQRLEKYRYR